MKQISEEATAVTAASDSDNACTDCGRAWSGRLNFCGVCGNRLIPYSQLKKFFPNTKFMKINY